MPPKIFSDTNIFLHSTHEYLEENARCCSVISRSNEQKVMAPKKVFDEIAEQKRKLIRLIEHVMRDEKYEVDGPNLEMNRYLKQHTHLLRDLNSKFIENLIKKYLEKNTFSSVEHFCNYLNRICSEIKSIFARYSQRFIENGMHLVERIRLITREMKHNSPDAVILATFFNYVIHDSKEDSIFVTMDYKHILSNRLELLKSMKDYSKLKKLNFNICSPVDICP